MKMFVSDVLKDGVWKPWFVSIMDFRTALRKMDAGKDSYKYRTRRVKTREEFEKYSNMEGVIVTKLAKQTDLWKVEWIA
jgi:hypothetical protein